MLTSRKTEQIAVVAVHIATRPKGLWSSALALYLCQLHKNKTQVILPALYLCTMNCIDEMKYLAAVNFFKCRLA
jgi:hypothetical protein